MQIKVKVTGEKIKLALLREGYANITEFAKKAGMTSSSITKTIRNGECTYSTAFKLMDKLGISAEEFIISE